MGVIWGIYGILSEFYRNYALSLHQETAQAFFFFTQSVASS